MRRVRRASGSYDAHRTARAGDQTAHGHRRRHETAPDLPRRPLGRVARRPRRRQPGRPDEPAGATYNATPEQYEEAVEAAVAAFEVTRTLPAYERGRILREISAGIRDRREELGRLIALEAGKPIRDALVEVDRATLTFRLGAEEAERMTGEVIPLDLLPSVEGPGRDHPPLPDRPDRGDQPVQLPAQPGRPQARARRSRRGNPIVLKPPSKDPLTMLDDRRDHRGGRRAGGLGVASCR